jgi:diguanylate cyclase (GGDEF)-like protein/PAS domain S-box-containing protein
MPLFEGDITPSEDRLFDLSLDMICVVGFDGTFKKINRAWQRTLGYEPGDLVGALGASFIHEEDVARTLAAGEAMLGGNNVASFENRFRCKDGSYRWLHWSAAADFEADVVYAVARDITERKEMEKALRASEERYRQLVESLARSEETLASAQAIAHLGSWDHNIRTDQISWSDELYFIYGLKPGGVTLTHEFIKDRTHRDDRAALDEAIARSRESRTSWAVDIRIVWPDQSVRWIHSMGQFEFDDAGQPRRVFGTALDITERKRAELDRRKSELSLAAAQHLAHMGSWESDLVTGEVVASAEFYNIYGLDPKTDRIDRSTLWEQDHIDDLPAVRRAVADSMRDRKRYHLDHRIVRRDGAVRWVHEQGEFTFDETGRPITAVGAVLDITDRKAAEERLAFLAHHDALTNLPNRVFLGPRLAQSIARALDSGRLAAVLFLDLDRFKYVNDTLGHRVGDTLLKGVSQRLRACVRNDDCIARTGGDEFIIVADDIASIDDVGEIAQKIVDAFAEPFRLGDDELYVTASLGVCICPQDGVEPDTLVRNADTAMYRAKDSGRNRFCTYTADMHAAALARVSIEKRLYRALEDEQFELHYQPAASLETGTFFACEALLRWRSPDRGLVLPADFILVAEETGLIVPIGAWVLREAARQSKAWADAGTPWRVSVNVSGRQLRDASFIDEVWRAITDAHADARLMGIEITESAALGEPEVARDVLGECRRLGMDILLDDFGTHYSSLTYLKKLPIDVIKIDRSFVAGLPADPGDGAIVKSVIGLGESLRCRVIAEGVETQAQADWLRAAGCKFATGYWFAKPMAAPELAAFHPSKSER